MLSDTAVRTAKPAAKPFKLYDERGLYLLVQPNGSRWWRFKYCFAGRERLLSVGVFPDVTLKQARQRRDDARALVANGVDPSEHRQATRDQQVIALANSFELIASEWLLKHGARWAPGHAEKITSRLKRDVFPWIGAKPVSAITAPELLRLFRRVEDRGAIETAHRAKQNCGQVFRYAIATGRAERDPTADLKGALMPVVERHYATITNPKHVGALLRAINGYEGSFVTRCALQLAPLLFVRPGELRQAEWAEFDLNAAEWRIPAAKMKMRAQHIVPLSRQAVELLSELKPLTGRGNYVFPGAHHRDRPMSENTLIGALRRLGYAKGEMTAHGFRSIASTMLNELGWRADAIERQLAHGERDAVRAAYNYAEHLQERRQMMQAWADHLDSLRANRAVVTDIRAAA
jgi:integrase